MKCKTLFQKIHYSFMNLKLNKKLLIGYSFLVFIPVILFSSLVFCLNYHSTVTSNRNTQKQEMNNFQEQFSSILEQLSNYSYFFQNNTEIMAYLDNEYTTTSDILYHYLASMEDTFNCFSYDSRVSSITLYGMKQYTFTIPGELENIDSFPESHLLPEIQKHIDGYWHWNSSGQLTFYKMLFDPEYHFLLGVLRMEVQLPELLEQLTSSLDYTWYFHSTEHPLVLFSYDNNTLTTCSPKKRDSILNSSNFLISK